MRVFTLKSKYILGISAFYHDSAACIIQNETIVAAAQEERFTRVKHDSSFPINAINYCINEAGITYSDLDFVSFYEKPFLKFERILETYLAFAPKGFFSFIQAMPLWIKDKLFQKNNIINLLKQNCDKDVNWKDKLVFSEHHLSHAASAFYPSPFSEAAILTLDGVGEWTTSSISIGKDNKISILKEVHFPHSIGLLYSAFTYYLGFKVNSGEYKVMGLAPFGDPVYEDLIKNKLIRIKNDGSFQLNMSYFNYCVGFTMTNRKFHKLFNGNPRKPESEITQREMDLAASIQKVTEELVIKICKFIREETNQENLCLAGGVALNCVANGKLINENIFKNVWIQPAAGDAGGSLGAAYSIYYQLLKRERKKSNFNNDAMKGGFLGPSYKSEEIEYLLNEMNADYEHVDEKILPKIIAELISEGKAIGLMNGRMEFGPRALGHRSIIADPRDQNMQSILNNKIKFRESFRPFAPSIIEEEKEKYFELSYNSPYMLTVANVKKINNKNSDEECIASFGFERLKNINSQVPAVTHVDYSARVQTVSKNTNPFFYDIINEFYKLTGCPVIINTSFNIRGEPIVCSPIDAFKCFMGTNLDVLVIEDIILHKNKQKYIVNKNDYKNLYSLD